MQQPCMGSGHGRPRFSTSDSNIAAEATQTCTLEHHARTHKHAYTHSITPPAALFVRIVRFAVIFDACFFAAHSGCLNT